jgi:predicted kinase
MRRFDETLTLDRVAARGGLDDDLLAAVVDAVLASHAAAARRPGRPAADDLALYVTQNREAFAENADVFPPADAARLVERQSYEWVRAEPLLLERGEEGFVRRCHGDLHLRNIVLIDGRPVLFDAVEFSDAIATGDVLYDLAFLIMDLWGKGHARAANLVLNRYLRAARADAIAGLAAMPLFLSIRASIRAKVTAAGIPALPAERRAEAFEEARRYFDLSIEALKPVDPVVVAIGGLSGTGKSTLAAALAPTVGRLPGAIHLSSDVLRKRLAGVAETERLPAASYTRAASERVYAELRAETAAVLAAGEAVVVDAVHLTADERDAIEAVALGAKARFLGVWLDAPLDDIVARIEARRGGPSDATADVARSQAAVDAGAIGWLRVDTRQGLDATLARVSEAIRATA